jgi:hypothetical protein
MNKSNNMAGKREKLNRNNPRGTKRGGRKSIVRGKNTKNKDLKRLKK